MPLVLYYQNYHCMLLSPESTMDNLSWKMAKMLVRLCLSRGFAEIPVASRVRKVRMESPSQSIQETGAVKALISPEREPVHSNHLYQRRIEFNH